MFELFGVSGLMDLMLQFSLLGAMMGFGIHWIASVEGQWWLENKLFKRPSVIRVKLMGGRSFHMDILKVNNKKDSKEPKPADDKLLIDTLSMDAPIARRIGSNARYIFQFHDQPVLFDPWSVEMGRYEITEEAKSYLAKANAIAQEVQGMQADLDKAYEEKNQEQITKIMELAKVKQEEYTRLMQFADSKRVFTRATLLPVPRLTALYQNVISQAKAKVYATFLKMLETKWNMIFWLTVASAVASGITAILSVLQRFGK